MTTTTTTTTTGRGHRLAPRDLTWDVTWDHTWDLTADRRSTDEIAAAPSQEPDPAVC